jgi:AcrR family transcriptional regulator
VAKVGAMSEQMTEAAKRPYRMRARAASKAATRERILDSAGRWFSPEAKGPPSLERIAKDAETTVQTLLRHFGSREGLLDAALRRASDAARRERAQVPVGDVPAAVQNLVRHYERWGSAVLRILAEEHRSELVRRATDLGREVHRDWVDTTFSPQLAELDPGQRELRRAQLVAVCDVYSWKVLRRDMGLSVEQTEAAIVGMIRGL